MIKHLEYNAITIYTKIYNNKIDKITNKLKNKLI